MLAFPIVAVALLTLSKEQNPLLQTVAFIGVAILIVSAAGFAAGLTSDRLAKWVGNTAARIVTRLKSWIRRGPVKWDGASFMSFRHEAVGLLKRRWHVLTLAVLAGQLTVFLVLFTSLRIFDVTAGEVSAIEVFAAWSLVRLLGSIPITPGGIGIVEVGLTTALVGFGGHYSEVVGTQTLIGKTAEVRVACRPRGQVFLEGELWEAECAAGADVGSRVRVLGV